MESNSPTSARAISGLNEVDKAWLAGILDGEGSLYMPRNGSGFGYALKLEVYNTSHELLDKVMSIYQRLGVRCNSYKVLAEKTSALTKKPVRRLCVTRRDDVLRVLSETLPHLTAKRAIAQAVLDLYSTRGRSDPWKDCDVARAKQVRAEFMPRTA